MLKLPLLLFLTVIITVNGVSSPYHPFYNLPFGQLFLQPQDSPDQLRARFGSLLRKPFQSEEYKRPISIYGPEISDREGVCMMMGAALITDECIEYVNNPKTFMDANSYCQGKGGTLWVPKQNEGFLFAKTALYFKDAYANANYLELENGDEFSVLGWVGVIRDSIARPYLTVTGEDYTWAPTFNLFPLREGERTGCVVAAADNGAVALPLTDCETQYNFFCEYIPVEKTRGGYDDSTKKISFLKLG